MSSNESMRKAMADAIAILQSALAEDDAPPVKQPPVVEPEGPVGEVPPTKPITSVQIENLGEAQINVPFTFGQAFAVGDLQPSQTLAGLQMDVKATHADGSVRHAIVSGLLPALATGETKTIELRPGPAGGRDRPVKMAVLAAVTLVVGGATYRAENGAFDGPRWLDGPIATEYPSTGKLLDDKGNEHPHLHVRFAMRCYDQERTRVEVVIENDWAYEPGPRNFTYDAMIEVMGKQVLSEENFTHYHHARWRSVFWVGGEPKLNLQHDPRYLIETRALPNYDLTVEISEKYLAELSKRWSGARTEPMGAGLALPAMPTTGGREDIGLNPGWAVAWLLSQDARAREVALGTADLSGSWSSHYRDKNTGLPVSLIDYPYMTINGNPGDTRNPVTKVREEFPLLPRDAKGQPLVTAKSPNQHDVSHQPNLVYLPYLLTGEHYYLEELQFWAMYDVFSSNPGYRENVKGLLHPLQVRGQAWALRTLAEAAYITPEGHSLKHHFLQILDSNLDWYNAEYTDNPRANSLGFLAGDSAVVYNLSTGIAPWQDDFFTQSVGHVAELGFEKAERLLAWKVKFPVERMNSEYGVPHAAIYALSVRDSKTSPFYDSINQAFETTLTAKDIADAAKLKPGELTGYSATVTGYPSNMQPALAYAADTGDPAARRAWSKFMSRSVKPDYGMGAQFAIVPRTV